MFLEVRAGRLSCMTHLETAFGPISSAFNFRGDGNEMKAYVIWNTGGSERLHFTPHSRQFIHHTVSTRLERLMRKILSVCNQTTINCINTQ
jgi:hypothetical protein